MYSKLAGSTLPTLYPKRQDVDLADGLVHKKTHTTYLNSQGKQKWDGNPKGLKRSQAYPKSFGLEAARLHKEALETDSYRGTHYNLEGIWACDSADLWEDAELPDVLQLLERRRSRGC